MNVGKVDALYIADRVMMVIGADENKRAKLSEEIESRSERIDIGDGVVVLFESIRKREEDNPGATLIVNSGVADGACALRLSLQDVRTLLMCLPRVVFENDHKDIVSGMVFGASTLLTGLIMGGDKPMEATNLAQTLFAAITGLGMTSEDEEIKKESLRMLTDVTARWQSLMGNGGGHEVL